MKISQIAQRLELSHDLWNGVYVRRPGSRKDASLFCWWNENPERDCNGAVCPHISVNGIGGDPEFDEFHLSCPYSYLSGFEQKLENANYHRYYKVVSGAAQIFKNDLSSVRGGLKTKIEDQRVKWDNYFDKMANAFVRACEVT